MRARKKFPAVRCDALRPVGSAESNSLDLIKFVLFISRRPYGGTTIRRVSQWIREFAPPEMASRTVGGDIHYEIVHLVGVALAFGPTPMTLVVAHYNTIFMIKLEITFSYKIKPKIL